MEPNKHTVFVIHVVADSRESFNQALELLMAADIDEKEFPKVDEVGRQGYCVFHSSKIVDFGEDVLPVLYEVPDQILDEIHTKCKEN